MNINESHIKQHIDTIGEYMYNNDYLMITKIVTPEVLIALKQIIYSLKKKKVYKHVFAVPKGIGVKINGSYIIFKQQS